jgi:hypothetical protein
VAGFLNRCHPRGSLTGLCGWCRKDRAFRPFETSGYAQSKRLVVNPFPHKLRKTTCTYQKLRHYSSSRWIAGWSSPVARQAHNLKVTGSNPVPATNFPSKKSRKTPVFIGLFFPISVEAKSGPRSVPSDATAQGSRPPLHSGLAPQNELRRCPMDHLGSSKLM